MLLTNAKIYDIILMLNGVWRRLVARYLGVVEAVGSSPVTPTNENKILIFSYRGLFLYETYKENKRQGII